MKSFIFLLFFVTASCSTGKVEAFNVRFDPKEVEWVEAKGGGQISGQVFLRSKFGNTRTCAGEEIFLIPKGKYSSALMGEIFKDSDQGFVFTETSLENASSGFKKLRLASRCNAQGSFEFLRIPKGRYFVFGEIEWISNQHIERARYMREVEVAENHIKRLLIVHREPVEF